MKVPPFARAIGARTPEEAKDQSAGCANGEAATYNASVICGSTLAEPAHSEEIDTPMRRTRLRIGNWAASSSALIDARVE